MNSDEKILVEMGDKLLQCERQRLITRIKLNAIKEGMRRAAEIADGETFAIGGIRTESEVAYDQGCKDAEKAILAAAEQLTEKDL